MRLLWAFRALALGALLLGLANLLGGFAPRWAIDTHLLLGVLAVLVLWGMLWPGRTTGLALTGIILGALLLVLGLGLRLGWWGGTIIGLIHLAAALATIAVGEMSAARARRVGARRRG